MWWRSSVSLWTARMRRSYRHTYPTIFSQQVDGQRIRQRLAVNRITRGQSRPPSVCFVPPKLNRPLRAAEKLLDHVTRLSVYLCRVRRILYDASDTTVGHAQAATSRHCNGNRP